MTSISYDEIFENFLGNVTDQELLSLSQSDAYQLMKEYLHKSVASHYVRRLFSSITLDDDVQVLYYELEYVYDEDADREFIITALSKWMVYEWFHGRVNSLTNILQFFGGKEQKFYSQSAHITELRGLRDDAYAEAKRFILDRGWISNTYLDS